MRILIVHHGRLPGGDQPVTGGALRAWHHGEALRRAGHEVHLLSRAQDTPGGFASPADLVRRGMALRPDRVIAVQPEDAPALRALGVPLCVDLYAPRLLEAPFEGRLAEEASGTLRALAAGDVFLVSNARQRMAWLGLMALAGVDVRTDPTLLVPLAAPEGPRRRAPRSPVLVAGGVSWPWQDPRPALEAALAVLDARGEGKVVWYGGAPLLGEQGAGWTLPEHPRLEAPGWVGRDTLLQAYAGATAALDWMRPNPERRLAFSFRHADYLGCGLPILTGPDTALTDLLGEAGWVTELPGLPDTLSALLDDAEDRRRRSRAARALARGPLSLEAASAPLVAWVADGTRHPRAEGPLVDAARLSARAASAEARAESAETARATAEAETARKRQEVAALTSQVQDLIATNGRLARAVDEVAGFKREAIALLGHQGEHAARSLDEANRELAILRADLSKKSAELAAMDDLRARLEHDLDNLRQELARHRAKRW
jgi:hypothetical protein